MTLVITPDLDDSDDDLVPDLAPPTGPETDICKEPGCHNAPEPYGGRGPRPKYCSDHKGGTAKKGSRKTGASNTQAVQAAAILAQYNAIMVIPLTFALPKTASEIADRNEGFEMMALESLRADPALCKAILRGGSRSGQLGLLLAYGMMLTAVVPAAMEEIQDKREAKRLREGELEG